MDKEKALMIIRKSNKKDKRLVAIFIRNVGEKSFVKMTHFGSATGSTYVDHHDNTKRMNYIKRHSQLNEDWTNPYMAGTLSRFILWEEPTIEKALNAYKEKFNFE